MCNRDERRTRPEADAPVMRSVGRRAALFPLDPLSGGTWIGMNDVGLALALLNRSAEDIGERGPRRSRGTIIPRLLGCGVFDEVLDQAMAIEPERFEPFRLIAIHGGRIATIASHGRTLSCACDTIDGPLMFTSSSLGDHIVDRPRRELFERMILRAPAVRRPEAQGRFHRHRWPSRPALSVLMTRPDARTVSRTIIDISGWRMSLHYRPLQVH